MRIELLIEERQDPVRQVAGLIEAREIQNNIICVAPSMHLANHLRTSLGFMRNDPRIHFFSSNSRAIRGHYSGLVICWGRIGRDFFQQAILPMVRGHERNKRGEGLIYIIVREEVRDHYDWLRPYLTDEKKEKMRKKLVGLYQQINGGLN